MNARKGRALRRGFTLIEMLAVAIIIGILAMIAIPAIVNAREQAADAACDANRKLIVTAINNYKIRTGNAVNASTNWATLAGTLDTNGYLSPTPTCAAASSTQYTVTFATVSDGTATGIADATKVTVTCPASTSHGTNAGLL